ncbi:TetR/AcrR family transcriptional regulator [Paenibacillus filicis]|uniref:TetR/AcrR family transcriptional regulator n=1 Tax=Paenibacillus filicis TaxID=669464 RepID=A0ABU9DWF9_9BACL
MARPLSEEKRKALLAAAANEIASVGIAASTSKIAKNAGVAEGTLFVYFPTKDDLLNQLYLDLKSDLTLILSADYSVDASVQEQFQRLWSQFVEWGASHPNKWRALRQLSVSERITEDSQRAGETMFTDFQTMVAEGFKTGVLREQPVSFLAGIIQALADMVLEMAFREPDQLCQLKSMGWEALWGAISRP